MNTPRSILTLLAVAVLLPACEKNDPLDIAGPPEGGAFVKYFNFAVDAPGVNFYRGDTKVSVVSVATCQTLTDANREQCTTAGAEAVTGVNYGGAGVAALYTDTPTGQQSFSGRIAAATDKNLPVATLQTNLAQGKFYSYYMSGIYDAATKTTDSFIVEDALPAVDYTKAYIRFVNASSTAPAIRLVAKNRTTAVEESIGAEVAYKGAGTFVAIPAGAYDLSTRVAAGTAGPFTRTNVSFSSGRIYTITARGNTAVTSTMALDFTANR